MKPTALLLSFLFFPLPLLAAGNLMGSPEARALENAKADEFSLERIADERSMTRLVEEKRLIPVPNNDYVRWHHRFPKRYAFYLPHADDFLVRLGRDFRSVFNKPIIVTSAIRPISYQRKLATRNRNAAPTEGSFASTHPTGATIDIGYKGLRREETAWIESYLSKKEADGVIQATKERYQACFHVMVYTPQERLAALGKNMTR